MPGDEITKIKRREAKSGRVTYSAPVVWHETRQSRVVVVPFFIPHSSHTELAIKIVTYRKADPLEQWFPVEEKSISLKEQAARKLLKALREHLTVAEEEADGSFILLPVREGTAQIEEHDPHEVASASAPWKRGSLE